jgi:hypothetical protein
MQVYVVMGNDLPDAVFSTKDAADDYVAKRKLEDNTSGDDIIQERDGVARRLV